MKKTSKNLLIGLIFYLFISFISFSKDSNYLYLNPVKINSDGKINNTLLNNLGLFKDSDFLIFLDRKTDSEMDITKNIYAYKHLIEIKQDDFEPTKDFEKRKKENLEKLKPSIDEFEKKIYVFNYDDIPEKNEISTTENGKEIRKGKYSNQDNFKYNPDSEEWSFWSAPNAVISYTYVDEEVEMSNSLGNIYNVMTHNNSAEVINFEKTIKFSFPMKLEEAKNNKTFYTQLLYQPVDKNNYINSMYFTKDEKKATIEDLTKTTTTISGLKGNVVAILIWNKEKTKLLGIYTL